MKILTIDGAAMPTPTGDQGQERSCSDSPAEQTATATAAVIESISFFIRFLLC